MTPSATRYIKRRRKAENRIVRTILLCIPLVVTLLSLAVAFATKY